MKPGYYLNLLDDEHHAIDALSKSGIKKLLESPLSYWHSAPWNYDPTHTPSKAMLTGRARHCLLLEGQQAFEQRFCKGFDKADHPHALATVDDLKGFLKRSGITPKGTKATLIEQVMMTDPSAPILDNLKMRHQMQAAAKVEIPADVWEDVQQSAGAFGAIKTRLGTGLTEVTAVWDDPDLGVRCKARMDWVGTSPSGFGRIVDLKDCNQGMSVESFEGRCERVFANWRYDIDASFYTRAIAQTPMEFRDQTPSESQWLKGLSDNPGPGTDHPEFMLLFHRKVGIASEFLPRTVMLSDENGSKSAIGRAAWASIMGAAGIYRQFMAAEGARIHPWFREWEVSEMPDRVAHRLN